MKVLSFGSLNFDHIYQMDHFVLPGETMAASDYQRGFGGKGLKQSMELATIASSMTVQKPGAADAIPSMDEVKGII